MSFGGERTRQPRPQAAGAFTVRVKPRTRSSRAALDGQSPVGGVRADGPRKHGGHLFPVRQVRAGLGRQWALGRELVLHGSPVALPWAQVRRPPVSSHHDVDRHLRLVQNRSKTIACLMSLFSFPVTLPSLFGLYLSIAQMFRCPREETSLWPVQNGPEAGTG